MMSSMVLLAFLPLGTLAGPGTSFSARSNPSNASAYGVTSDPATAANQTFDYIVVGAGTAGTTIAARLSENANVRVLLVEAGGDNRTNPLVDDIYEFTVAYNTALDWAWDTDQNRTIHGGKTLGGSSSINGATWTRGMKEQYDSWSEFLDPSEANAGWNWDGIFPYMKKAEGFHPPNATQRAVGANDVPEYHGFTGPVQATFPKLMFAGPQEPYFAQTAANVTGLEILPDLNGGDPHCVSFVPNSLDPQKNDSRSSAATAYLSPAEHKRTNWLTLINHQVTKIIFAPNSTENQIATGVSFATQGGPTYTANVRRDVILSAGAISSPALLQLSGIGNATHLSSIGITPLVDLPAVGLNLQEQTLGAVGAHGTGFDPKGKGPSDVIAFPGLKEVFGDDAEELGQGIVANLTSWAQDMVGRGAAVSVEELEKAYKIQAGLIINSSAPILELLYNTGSPDDLGIVMWPLLPFSRGNVAITSTDPFTKPEVNVNYFGVPFDLEVGVAGLTMARKIFQTPPLSSLSVGETLPGFTIVPADNPFDAWADWFKSIFQANCHPIATTALGGVVDAQLKVHGTANVRVADAGIIPLQLSAHLQSTVYGIAEKAADILKSGL
ncbi:alcohol oxidase [Dentipellis sp. KUC8613]|nr:alcohol oxidase [Dentipellis sp. KUC8613]